MSSLRRTMLACALAAPIACGLTPTAGAVDHPDRFIAWSPDFKDNGVMAMATGATGTSVRGPWACGGKDASPAVSWSHAPKDTKSFAVVMDDLDAASGRGGTHWIAYDIPANVHALARNAGLHPKAFVGGDIDRKDAAYHGPCAEPGAKMHHFYFYVYALDVPPGTLPKGLKRADFAKAIQGHNTAEASFVGRFYHPTDAEMKKAAGKKQMSQR
jgi:Raf kinase inhibitor-like YbhB/YbcL family protein